MNEPESDRYQSIDRGNMNKPMVELVCPRCEARQARRSDSEHSGSFECVVCWHGFYA